MELRHLRYFIAVAEEQNVTRAAARLHVSQPPLTRQIHDLEQEVGVLLFERHGRWIRLTAAGKVFLREAKASLRRVHDAVERVRAFASRTVGKLHVGYAPTPTTEILPRILRRFQAKSPHVRIILHDHSSPEMLVGLRERRLDAAFMMEPSKQASRGVVFEKLETYPVGVAVSQTHAFARRKTVAVPELLDERIVSYAAAQYPDYLEFVRRAVGAHIQKKLRVIEECDGGPTLIAAVESGKGVSVCSSILTTSSGRRLKFIPIAPASTEATVGIAYRSGRRPENLNILIEAAKASRSHL